MLQCQGTFKEEAQQNQLLREAIAGDESVKGTFILRMDKESHFRHFKGL